MSDRFRCIGKLFLFVSLIAGPAFSATAAESVLSVEQIENRLFSKDKALSPVRRMAVDMPAITFEFNSATLTPLARRQLETLGRAMSKHAYRQSRFIIGGHTDAVGSVEYNKGLSDRRARSVIDYLVGRHGSARATLKPVGYGESRLISGLGPEDRGQRRAEIINLGKPN